MGLGVRWWLLRDTFGGTTTNRWQVLYGYGKEIPNVTGPFKRTPLTWTRPETIRLSVPLSLVSTHVPTWGFSDKDPCICSFLSQYVTIKHRWQNHFNQEEVRRPKHITSGGGWLGWGFFSELNNLCTSVICWQKIHLEYFSRLFLCVVGK